MASAARARNAVAAVKYAAAAAAAPPPAAPDATRPRAVVVGGSSGIGRGIALRLAAAQFDVTVVGRDAARGGEVVAAMGPGAHGFVPCDASLLANVADASARILTTHPRVDVLVLTQSIATLAGRTETAEGLDRKLVLHYFGRVAFAEHLLPRLRAAPEPRVLTVLSAGVHGVYAHYADDPELLTHFSLKNAADAAGLYNDVGFDALAAEPANARVAFFHAGPGFVNTAWGTDLPWALRMLVRAVQPFGRSAADCAECLLAPVLDTGARTGAVNLVGPDGEPAKQTPVHAEARPVVWGATRRVLDRVAAARAGAGGAAAAPATAAPLK